MLGILLSWIPFSNLQAQAPSEKNMGAYLFVFHQDATSSLYMATSRDGYTFTALNNAQPIMKGDTLATQHGIRDPHIFRGPDGAFYLSMTDLNLSGKEMGFRNTKWERDEAEYGWGNNHGFVLMKSFDLIHWTRHIVHVDKCFPNLKVGCAWAPETTYDPETKKIMLYFTMRLGNGKTKLYYSYTDNDFTKLETEPKLLFKYPKPEVQVLDADISRTPDGRYCLMYVAQEQPGGIRMAFSKHINRGYKYVDQWSDAEPGACEAPNVWKRIGENKWVLMYDVFSLHPHNFGFCETTDFKTFKDLGHFNDKGSMMKATNFISPKHGAIIPITTAEADRIEKYWQSKVDEEVARKKLQEAKRLVPLDSIRLSDPCILADKATMTYYMTGTGGMLWTSKDLKYWEGPKKVAQTDPKSWMGPNPMIWAAELHQYKGKYYYFATFTNRDVIINEVKGNKIERRACQVLVSDKAAGPYLPFGDDTYLPATVPTLDGTFWVDKNGKPYMVYCGEWLQNWNGTIEKIELKPDLSGTVGKGKVLFRAFDSPWSKEKNEKGKIGPNKVTDGPWLFRTKTGKLGMLWTSWIYNVYTQGVAYSKSGTLDGPWVQEKKPITPPNFGHSMLFQTFDGQWLMSVHSHYVNAKGEYVRIPHLFKVNLDGDKLVVGEEYKP